MPRAGAVALAVLLALVGLLAACSDDDGKEGFPAALADDAAEGAGGGGSDDGPGTGVCGLVALAQLRAVLGVELAPGQPGAGSCTYRAGSGRGTLTVNVGERPADPGLALETAAGTCDPGSVVDVEVRGADGAFTCTVAGVSVAAGTSEGAYVVVLGAGLEPEAGTAAVPLVEALEEVLAGT